MLQNIFVLTTDGEVLTPVVEILDIRWLSVGSRMIKNWPLDGSILVRRCCRKSNEQFCEEKIKQTPGCVDTTVACKKLSVFVGIPL